MEGAKSLLKQVLGVKESAPSKSADKVALAASGVGTEKEVAQAQKTATIEAAGAVQLSQSNADLKPARQALAGLTTRYTKAFVYEGITALNVDQKDVMIDPISFGDYTRLIELPRMVSVNPDSVLFDESGLATHAGRPLANNLFVVQGAVSQGITCQGLQNANLDVWDAMPAFKLRDPVIGWEIVGKPFNINRGTGRISLDYYCGGVTQAAWMPNGTPDIALEGTTMATCRVVVLRFGAAHNTNYSFAHTAGTAGTDADRFDLFSGTHLVVKQDAYTIKNPGVPLDDGLVVNASNMEVWLRPLILSGTTAPALIQAIQDPGVDMASFVSNMYR